MATTTENPNPNEQAPEALLVEGFIVVSSLPSEALFNQSFTEAFSDLINIKKSFPLFPQMLSSRLSSIRRDWYTKVLSNKEVYRLGKGQRQIIVLPFHKAEDFLKEENKITRRLEMLEAEILAYIESPQKWGEFIKEHEIKVRDFDAYIEFRIQFFRDLKKYGESITDDLLPQLSFRGKEFILACRSGTNAIKHWMRDFIQSINLPGRFTTDLIPLRLDTQFFEQFVEEQTAKMYSEVDYEKRIALDRVKTHVRETRERLTAEAMTDISEKVEGIMKKLLEAAKKEKFDHAIKIAKNALESVETLTQGAYLSRRVRMIMAEAQDTITAIEEGGVDLPSEAKSARIQALISQIQDA